MEKGAAREGKIVWDIAEFYTRAFMKDWERLNLVAAFQMDQGHGSYPRADRAGADPGGKGLRLYRPRGRRLFRHGRSSRATRDFAGLDIEGHAGGPSRRACEGKRNPTDFALWKILPTGREARHGMGFPLGRGFPGWHIECSAMAMKHLGRHPGHPLRRHRSSSACTIPTKSPSPKAPPASPSRASGCTAAGCWRRPTTTAAAARCPSPRASSSPWTSC